MGFAIGIELANVVAVQRPHDADARQHQPAATDLRGVDQVFDRGLPLLELLFGPRQLLDISGRVFERDELATAWQRDRIVEPARPTPLANGANPACRIEP
jgi:hypothetical protein